MSFTQSELDEVLNTMFTRDGIVELHFDDEPDEGKPRWRVFYKTGPKITQYDGVVASTPAEAIRAATVALVAHRLTK